MKRIIGSIASGLVFGLAFLAVQTVATPVQDCGQAVTMEQWLGREVGIAIKTCQKMNPGRECVISIIPKPYKV